MLLVALPLFHHVKNEIKKEVKYKILKRKFEESDIIKFSVLDLQNAEWEATDEFFHEGSMYDVVKTEVINGMQYFYCIKDHKENIIHPLKRITDLFLFKKEARNLSFDKEKQGNPLSHNISISYFQKVEFIFNFCEFYKEKNPSFEIIKFQKFYPKFFNPPKNHC